MHTIPFRLSKNKVLVRAVINGRYSTELVLDTGAERIGLSTETARRAGVQPVSMSVIAGVGVHGYRPLALARAESIQIGTLKVANVPVSIRNAVVGTLPRWQTETFSPVSMGLSVVVDYKQKKLTIARRLPESAADIACDAPSRSRWCAVLPELKPRGAVRVDPAESGYAISTFTACALAMAPRERITSRFRLPGGRRGLPAARRR